jgi:lipopolysaccharide transport system ATP-binding protein
MDGTVISIENLSKNYRLGVIGTGTFRGDLQRWWAIRRGKPDPYLKIDEADHGNQQKGTIWALKDINFSVQQGEALGIIGRNGAGKSTLLKILSRVTVPTSGEVKVRGHVASLLEVGTGFHPELTGRENIFLNGAILGMSRAEVQRKFDEIVDFSGVEQFIDTPVKRYSSGMYVRLAFAVAAHLEPEILIVDEVLAVGDAEFQKKCLGKMGDVAHEGRTVFFVSHNMQAIQSLCTRAILLSSGQIVANGIALEVVTKYLESIPKVEATDHISTLITRLPDDPNFRLIDVKITQNNSPLNQQALNGEPIKVISEYEVKKRTANFRLYLDILDNQGTLLIKSFHDCDSPKATIAEPGTYISEVIIPSDFLAPREYLLRIGATVFGDRQLAGQEGLCIPINVRKTSRINRGYTLEVEVGKLAPLLPWETKRVS